MGCLACVARLGRALHSVCQAFASWLVNETGISCRAVEQVDDHVCSEIWCKRCYCATCKSDTKSRKAHGQTWHPVFWCILVDTVMQAKQKFLWVEGKLENRNEGCMLQLTPFHKVLVCTAV